MAIFSLGGLSIWLIPTLKTDYYKKIKQLNILIFGKWDSVFEIVKIKSTSDESIQYAYFLSSLEKKPLLVSLHTWSGSFSQKDPLAELALKNNWNYIHPDFRGANRQKESCLSPFVISDIDDAIDNSNVDLSNIFIVGASGGGYTTLGSYLRTKHQIKRFISWVPISDLSAWYRQSLSIGNTQYADDIIACTSSSLNFPNEKEARKRSPQYWEIPPNNNGGLDIYVGINDGHAGGGSVPISHSLLFFNHLSSSWGLDQEKISTEMITNLLTRNYNKFARGKKIQGRNIIYQKKTHNTTLTVFEGGHEILSEYTFKKIIELSD